MSDKSLRQLMRGADGTTSGTSCGLKALKHQGGSNCALNSKFRLRLKEKTKNLLDTYTRDTEQGMEEFLRDYREAMKDKAVQDRARVAARVAAKPKKGKNGKKNRKPKK